MLFFFKVGKLHVPDDERMWLMLKFKQFLLSKNVNGTFHNPTFQGLLPVCRCHPCHVYFLIIACSYGTMELSVQSWLRNSPWFAHWFAHWEGDASTKGNGKTFLGDVGMSSNQKESIILSLFSPPSILVLQLLLAYICIGAREKQQCQGPWNALVRGHIIIIHSVMHIMVMHVMVIF